MDDRTMIAAMCLQSLISRKMLATNEDHSKMAVEYADALLKELDDGGMVDPPMNIRDQRREIALRNEALEEAARVLESRNMGHLDGHINDIRALKKGVK